MKRPVNLDLTTMRFPITAIVSILHRISGVLLFLSIPAFLCLLSSSLESPDGFLSVQGFLAHTWVKIVLWMMLVSLFYHLLAGIRHLLMDMGFADELDSATTSARAMILVFVILAVLLGVWLWV